METRILDALIPIPGHAEKKGFFPEITLASIISAVSVEQELTSCLGGKIDPQAVSELTHKICGIPKAPGLSSYKKIFTILVLCDKLEAIQRFIDAEITDGHLPLAKVPVRRKHTSTNTFSLASTKHSSIGAKPLDCFRGWKFAAIRTFEEWQWTTLAPFFHPPERKNVEHFLFGDQIPLPFISDSRFDDYDRMYDRLEYEGGFSSVFKVEIHPEQHAFHDSIFPPQKHIGHSHSVKPKMFAIKCLLSRSKVEFKREVDMLIKFSGNSHDHLISLQATYEQFRRFYLIFPCAEGDLRDYWKNKNPNPSMDMQTVRWVSKQCSGIAAGLSEIHRYKSNNLDSHHHGTAKRTVLGHHGDIKPENILWFRDQVDMGTLKITDFGLAEFKIGHSTFPRPKSTMAVSPSYRPPECDLDGYVGRSSDIWALGCLYLEMITWLLGGWDLLTYYLERRQSKDPGWYDMMTDTFFEIPSTTPGDKKQVAIIKAEVKQVRVHDACTPLLFQMN